MRQGRGGYAPLWCAMAGHRRKKSVRKTFATAAMRYFDRAIGEVEVGYTDRRNNFIALLNKQSLFNSKRLN
jgi:hypothetical protein